MRVHHLEKVLERLFLSFDDISLDARLARLRAVISCLGNLAGIREKHLGERAQPLVPIRIARVERWHAGKPPYTGAPLSFGRKPGSLP
jgi:hypothetical protein